METLRGLGSAVGEYTGNGQGETQNDTRAATSVDQEGIDAEPGIDDQTIEEEEEENSSNDYHPLLFFYDCETTGFSMYNDHVTDIAARVVASPVPVPDPLLPLCQSLTQPFPAS